MPRARIGFNTGRPYILQAGTGKYNYYGVPTQNNLAGSAGSNVLTQGQGFTLTSPGLFGTKSLLATLDDTGADAAIGALSPQWNQGGWGYASTSPNVNMQNQPIGFSGPAGSAIGAPHPYLQAIQAGSHDGANSTNGQDVGLAWGFSSGIALPAVLFISYYYRDDPGWTFNINTLGFTFPAPPFPGDDNHKTLTYGAGPGIYPNNNIFWYLQSGEYDGWSSNSVVSGIAAWVDAAVGVSGAPVSLHTPDAGGHVGPDWPSSSDPGTPNILCPMHAATGWIKQELEILLSATNAVPSAGGGYINWYDNCARVMNYQGSTDAYGTASPSSVYRSVAIGGYNRDYTGGSSPLTAHAAANNVRYYGDFHLRVTNAQSGIQNCPRVEVGNNPVWANCTIREVQTDSAWTASSITVPSFNKARLPGGQTAYLFVTTAAGAIVSPTNLPSATVASFP